MLIAQLTAQSRRSYNEALRKYTFAVSTAIGFCMIAAADFKAPQPGTTGETGLTRRMSWGESFGVDFPVNYAEPPSIETDQVIADEIFARGNDRITSHLVSPIAGLRRTIDIAYTGRHLSHLETQATAVSRAITEFPANEALQPYA